MNTFVHKTDLENRTLDFSCQLIDFARTVPGGTIGDVLLRQMLRSGTSVGANYREANRSASRAEFVHRINISEKEASETNYWFEICLRKEIGNREMAVKLARESEELTKIFSTIGRNTKRK